MATITLKAADGHQFSAYEARPAGKPRGGLVVLQEIFGVNEHIRRVADGYAADGYYAVAPALFDRAERNAELGYDRADIDRGIALRKDIPLDAMLADVAASVERAATAGKVAVIGYCLGGSLAWMAAQRVPGVTAAVGYYGGMIAGHLSPPPRVPVMLHFGSADSGIPLADVEKIRAAADPARAQVFVYKGAGHAFNRDGTAAHHADSARVARRRTLEFLGEHLV
jgi:carboxymethylenebutenolidase